MSDSPLKEVLVACREVMSDNKTDDLYHKLEVFLNKNYAKITEEANKERSPKRRVYGKMESTLVDYFMRVCNYGCSRTNIQYVHQIMMMLGFSGYENETRFRQRTENTLKKWKKQGRKIPSAKKRMSCSCNMPIHKLSRSARYAKRSMRSSNLKPPQKKQRKEVVSENAQNELFPRNIDFMEGYEQANTSMDTYSVSPQWDFMPLEEVPPFDISNTVLFDNSNCVSIPTYGMLDTTTDLMTFCNQDCLWDDVY